MGSLPIAALPPGGGGAGKGEGAEAGTGGGSEAATPAAEEPAFLAFAGSGRRLDGKSAGPSAPVPLARVGSGNTLVPMARSASGASVGSSGAGDGDGSRPASGKGPAVAGKVVFGAGPSGRPRPTLGGPKVRAATSPPIISARIHICHPPLPISWSVSIHAILHQLDSVIMGTGHNGELIN